MRFHSLPAFLLLVSTIITITSFFPATADDVFTAEQESDVISFVESLRQCRGVVGVTLAVVRGNASWTRGFGLADRERRREVSTSDLFGIGSLTKAFTSALISLFINDTSRYSWDTPVVEILGEDFEVADEQLTRQLTLKDMLSHRTGLSTTNLPLFAGTDLSPEQMARRIRHLPVKKPFRDEFEYNNWMYGLAGRVAEAMGGAPWEELLRTRLLGPLNMTQTVVMGNRALVEGDDFARPYVQLGEEVVLSDPDIYNIHPFEAAGAIASSADDMVQWMLLHTNQGRSQDGSHVLNDTRMREMATASVALSEQFRASVDLWRPQFPVTYASDGYGYGWFTASYRGYPVRWHSGGFYAYTSYLAFLPHLQAGVFVSSNGPGSSSNVSAFNRLLFYRLADLLLGQDRPWLDATTACTFPHPWLNHHHDEDSTTNDTATSSSTSCEDHDEADFPDPGRYAGVFRHPLFGEVSVERNGSRALHVRYGLLLGRLYRQEEEEEEESPTLWRVVGKLGFLFRQGNRTSCLRLTFSRPAKPGGPFQELLLQDSFDKEDLVFQRKASPGPSNRACGGGGGGGVGVGVVVVGVLVAGFLSSSSSSLSSRSSVVTR